MQRKITWIILLQDSEYPWDERYKFSLEERATKRNKLPRSLLRGSLFCILGVIVILGCSYYLRSSGDETALNNQQQSEKEFLDFSAQKKKLPQPNEEVSLVAVGDISFSRGIERMIKKQNDINYPFLKVRDYLKSADLDNNLIQETYTLENGRLTITENTNIIWQSPTDWWIDNFVLADSNNDGISDINLSLWKAGNFGTSKPFWIKENDMSVKNHFFVYDFVNGAIKPIWGSSNLGVPNCEFRIEDIDGDEKNDLIVIEGDYLPTHQPRTSHGSGRCGVSPHGEIPNKKVPWLPQWDTLGYHVGYSTVARGVPLGRVAPQKPECNGNYVAIWKWNDWGFSNEWRSKKGNFFNLKIEKINEKSYIIVDSF